MAKLTIHDKVDRVMRLLLALRRRPVASALAAHGFTAADIQEGFRLLAAITVADMKGAERVLDRADLMERMNAWTRRWFPIVEAALRRHHPDALQKLFPKVIDGPQKHYGDAMFFLAAYDKLGPTHPAIELLHGRGLTDAVLTELRSAIEPTMKTLDDSMWPNQDFTEPEEKLWAWYLEWSAIVRARVKDKRLLRELGFGGEGGSASE